MRIEKAVNLINKADADALILFNESNMHYFCGFSPSEGIIFILKDGTAYQTGLKRYNPANKGKLDNISEVADKILGITINDHKSKLF